MSNETQNTTPAKTETPVLGKIILTLKRPHRSQKDGKMRFIYTVSGDQDALNQYIADKKAEGFDAKNAQGEITYFGPKLVPNGTELVKQTKGYWFPVNERFEILTAAVAQTGNYEMGKDLAEGKIK